MSSAVVDAAGLQHRLRRRDHYGVFGQGFVSVDVTDMLG